MPSSFRRHDTFLFSLFIILLVPFLVVSQLVTTTDDNGNSIIASIETDAAGDILGTETISTLAPAVTDNGGAAGGGGGGIQTTTPCYGSTCPAPPTTWISYETVNGVQQTVIVTFTATTPVTPPPSSVPAGVIQTQASAAPFASGQGAMNSDGSPRPSTPWAGIIAAMAGLVGTAVVLLVR